MSWKVREHMGAYYGRSQKGIEMKGNLEKEPEV
jgi:hypothetical protein